MMNTANFRLVRGLQDDRRRVETLLEVLADKNLDLARAFRGSYMDAAEVDGVLNRIGYHNGGFKSVIESNISAILLARIDEIDLEISKHIEDHKPLRERNA
jgi:hypothetical protein